MLGNSCPEILTLEMRTDSSFHDSRNLKIEDLSTSSEMPYKQYRKIEVGDLLICTKRWREIQGVTHV
jgi:hypothetical protein